MAVGGIVFQIGKPTETLRLLHWTKELPRASENDPLGLELRVAARLANELLYCITSITPRARYYAFFPWAMQDYNERERLTKGDRGRIQGVLARERAMVLGAVLHHNKKTCEGGSLGGSDKAIKLVQKPERYYDLLTWKHLNNEEGQFGAAYKGSLINLGVFKTADQVSEEVEAETNELDKRTQSIEVRELSSLGLRLADAFGKSVQKTAYVSQSLTLKDKIAANVLLEFGSKAGLCEINHRSPKDRTILRDVFFANCAELNRPAHHRRRMSLLLLLACVKQARNAGVSLDARSFSDMCYFDAVIDEEEEPTTHPIALPAILFDIKERWRIFHTQGYLAVALQSLLVAVVRQIGNNPAGVEREQLAFLLKPPNLSDRFAEIFGKDLPRDFYEMTPRETLALCGVALGNARKAFLSIDATFSERQLEKRLVGGEANEAVAIVLASMLLYQTIFRHKARSSDQFNNWYGQHIRNDYADVALPGLIRFFEGEFGEEWIERRNGEILDRVLWRFVIRQHQTMSYERGFGGAAPLFHVDGSRVVATEMDYTDPEAKNSRFWSALQILMDLGLIVYEDEVYDITQDGEAWLASELGRVGAA